MILAFLLCTGWASAGVIRVAVASNFSDAIREITEAFEETTEHEVVLIFGSTGKHYAQIKNGAPYEAFFAADVRRPKLLEAEGIAQPGSRFTYAIGRVVLWSPDPGLVDAKGEVLDQSAFRYLAIANPKLAPYGKAAEQIMRARGLWDGLQGRMVRGENIGQTFQFVHSGNAELGFVALSQIRKPGTETKGSHWLPPQSLYDQVDQQAVLLKDNDLARAFLAFARSDQAHTIIRSYGYGVHDAE